MSSLRKDLIRVRKISYKQAAEVLGVSMQTIKTAVMEGRLTRCAHNTRTAMLLYNQVELFKGKRISEKTLTLVEKDQWERYRDIAKSPELLAQVEMQESLSPNIDLDKLIEQKVEEKMQPYIREQADMFEKEEELLRERKERFHKANPFLWKQREKVAV